MYKTYTKIKQRDKKQQPLLLQNWQYPPKHK